MSITVTWVGLAGDGESWSDADNWDLARVPTVGDAANIAGAAIKLDVPTVVCDAITDSAGNGTLTCTSSAVTAFADFEIESGTVLTFTQGAVLTNASPSSVANAGIVMEGSTTITGTLGAASGGSITFNETLNVDGTLSANGGSIYIGDGTITCEAWVYGAVYLLNYGAINLATSYGNPNLLTFSGSAWVYTDDSTTVSINVNSGTILRVEPSTGTSLAPYVNVIGGTVEDGHGCRIVSGSYGDYTLLRDTIAATSGALNISIAAGVIPVAADVRYGTAFNFDQVGEITGILDGDYVGIDKITRSPTTGNILYIGVQKVITALGGLITLIGINKVT